MKLHDREQYSINLLLICHCIIICPLVILLISYYINSLSYGQNVFFLSWFFTILSIWCILSWGWVTGKWFDPYMMFLFSAIMFHGGQVILESLRLNEFGILQGRFSSETLELALLAIIIGLACMHLGALLGWGGKKKGYQEHSNNRNLEVQEKSISLTGWLLLIVSLPPTIIVLTDSLKKVLLGGYFSLFAAEDRIGFSGTFDLLSMLLVPSLLYIMVGNKDNKSMIKLATVILCIYVGLQLFIGSRGVATMGLVAFLWIRHRIVKPLPKTLFISLGIGLGAVLFPLIKTIRNVIGTQHITLSYLYDTYSSLNNPLVVAISEMGYSLSTLAYTLELVPSVRAYDMGGSYLYAVFTLVPNLYWDIHPTVAHGTPSNWLVWTVEPEKAAAGGGNGYSFIAESFFNFGWVGIPLVLIVIGFLFGKLIGAIEHRRSPKLFLLLACTMVFLPQYARGDSASVLRNIVWYSILPLLVCIFLEVLIRAEKHRKMMQRGR